MILSASGGAEDEPGKIRPRDPLLKISRSINLLSNPPASPLQRILEIAPCDHTCALGVNGLDFD